MKFFIFGYIFHRKYWWNWSRLFSAKSVLRKLPWSGFFCFSLTFPQKISILVRENFNTGNFQPNGEKIFTDGWNFLAKTPKYFNSEMPSCCLMCPFSSMGWALWSDYISLEALRSLLLDRGGVSCECYAVVHRGRCSPNGEPSLWRRMGTWDKQTTIPISHHCGISESKYSIFQAVTFLLKKLTFHQALVEKKMFQRGKKPQQFSV